MMKNAIEARSKLAYSVKEVAEQTSLSKGYVRLEIKKGNLTAKNFGRRLLILNEDLKKYLQGKQN